MSTALALRDKVLREDFESKHGFVIKTTGDRFHAVFGSAADALATALKDQSTLIESSWGTTGPLQVRVAHHSGEAEVEARPVA